MLLNQCRFQEGAVYQLFRCYEPQQEAPSECRLEYFNFHFESWEEKNIYRLRMILPTAPVALVEKVKLLENPPQPCALRACTRTWTINLTVL